ncbi:MAG: tetratricopeptide repeat protein [Methylophilaceae bacterium]
MIKWSHKWFLLLLTFPALVAYGDYDEFGKTPQEAAMCTATIYAGRDTSDAKNWMHMHHFCDCVRYTNRAMVPSKDTKQIKLETAIGNCDYVLGATTPDFYMRQYVYIQKGKALRMLGKDGLAAAEFMKALSMNSNLVAAYQEMSDFYSRLGKREEALKFTVDGLKHVPNSKALQRRYTELGGKLPYPEPLEIEKPAMATPSPSSPNATPGTDVTVTPEQGNLETPPINGTSGSSKQTTKILTNESSTPIGSPTNPFCRFCPDLEE